MQTTELRQFEEHGSCDCGLRDAFNVPQCVYSVFELGCSAPQLLSSRDNPSIWQLRFLLPAAKMSDMSWVY